MGEPVGCGVAGWVAESWSARLAGAIEAMTGDLPAVLSKPALDQAPSGLLWWQHPLSLGPRAVIWIGAPESSWLAIGRHLLTSAGIEASEPADARNTFLEISSQAVSGLCQAISERLGRNVSSEGGAESGPDSRADLFEVDLKLAADSLPLYAAVAPGLAEAFEAAGTATEVATRQNAEAARPAPERETGPRRGKPTRSSW